MSDAEQSISPNRKDQGRGRGRGKGKSSTSSMDHAAQASTSKDVSSANVPAGDPPCITISDSDTSDDETEETVKSKRDNKVGDKRKKATTTNEDEGKKEKEIPSKAARKSIKVISGRKKKGRWRWSGAISMNYIIDRSHNNYDNDNEETDPTWQP